MGWATARKTFLAFTLLITLAVSATQMLYSRNWGVPLPVMIYPIAAGSNSQISQYISNLSHSDFSIIDDWMAREAARYNVPNPRPTQIRLGSQLHDLPPPFPKSDHIGWLILWQLKMRFWAMLNSPDTFWSWRTVRIYLVLHDPKSNQRLPHSLGLQKGLIGLVHGYAHERQTSQNAVVVAHELLHTVGATDKYDFWGNPVFPQGYASPSRKPLYPQRAAEIMAGRIPQSKYASIMAHSLRSSQIGPITAREINWIE